MASTLITTNADAMKRAARELSKQSQGLTPNRILNILAGAIPRRRLQDAVGSEDRQRRPNPVRIPRESTR
jgi:hypothetical protein